jgi:hypothetical protein
MPATYDRDELAVTAACSIHMTDFLQRLGVPDTRSRRNGMWARLSHYEIDVSHWERSPRGNPRYTPDMIAEAVSASTSMAEVMRRLGIRPAGGSHFHLSKRIKSQGLDTSHFTGSAHNRGKRGPRKAASEILVLLPEGSSRVGRERLLRAMLESGIAYRCSMCGCEGTWRGQPLVLAIDHVDGDWLDNRLQNLRFLCPNCHAQTSTWCRKKGPSISSGP